MKEITSCDTWKVRKQILNDIEYKEYLKSDEWMLVKKIPHNFRYRGI